jgi:hypothetical protein
MADRSDARAAMELLRRFLSVPNGGRRSPYSDALPTLAQPNPCPGRCLGSSARTLAAPPPRYARDDAAPRPGDRQRHPRRRRRPTAATHPCRRDDPKLSPGGFVARLDGCQLLITATQLPFLSAADNRGYTDFALFGRWCREGIFWVTRMKQGTAYTVEESRDLPQAAASWPTRSSGSPAPRPRPSAPTGCGASSSGMPSNHPKPLSGDFYWGGDVDEQPASAYAGLSTHTHSLHRTTGAEKRCDYSHIANSVLLRAILVCNYRED